MEIARLVLEYIKVLTSPAILALAGVIFFILYYKAEISALLTKPLRIRFPGGEVTTSQLEKATEALPNAEVGVPPAPPPQLPQNVLTPEQVQQIEDAFKAERARAALWEYRYLNYFLARSTQHVLDWLGGLGVNTTTAMLDSFWLPFIPSAAERNAIITALQAHHLIQIHGEVIEVTPKGREYIQWRGPLPPP